MFPNSELRNVFTLALVVQWIAHQSNMSMKVYNISFYIVKLEVTGLTYYIFIFYPKQNVGTR